MSSFLKRWWWALLLVAVGTGLARLRFDVDILDLLPPDEPAVQGLKLYQRHFTNARELVVTLRAPDAGQAEQAEQKPLSLWWYVMLAALALAVAESLLGNRHLSVDKEAA